MIWVWEMKSKKDMTSGFKKFMVVFFFLFVHREVEKTDNSDWRIRFYRRGGPRVPRAPRKNCLGCSKQGILG